MVGWVLEHVLHSQAAASVVHDIGMSLTGGSVQMMEGDGV
jgi:hypothetical protein